MTTSATIGFRDLPIENGADDVLDLIHQAGALSKFVQNCDTPMTIGIQGDWGSGKTSLMNLIRNDLNSDKHSGSDRYLNIWFNTWQYSQFGNEDNLSASLLLNLLSQINKAKLVPTAARDFVKSLLKSIIKATSFTAKIGDTTGVSVSGKDFLDEFLDTGTLDQATLFDRMREDFASLVRVMSEAARAPDDTDTTPQIAPYRRVVIYIDDLDRLPPTRAVELLEVIKNIIDVPGCIFVLAIDYSVVVSGLRQRKGYGDKGPGTTDDERKFFDKIIQVPYQMPSASYKLEKLLDHLTRASSQAVFPPGFIDHTAPVIIRESLGYNPRTLKRALNIHALFSHLLDEDGGADSELRGLTSALAFVFACIQISMPTLYDVVVRAPDPALAIFALARPDLVRELASESDLAESSMREHLEQRGCAVAEDTLLDNISALADEFVKTGLDDDRVQTIVASSVDFIAKQVKLTPTQRTQALVNAITLTRRTVYDAVSSMDRQDAPESSRFCGFLEMATILPELENRPLLVFKHPRGVEIPLPTTTVKPDYERASRRLVVLDEHGKPMTLAEMTRNVLERLKKTHGVTVNPSERKSTNAPLYWQVALENTESVGLDELRGKYQQARRDSPESAARAENAYIDQKIVELLINAGGAVVSDIQAKLGGSDQKILNALRRLTAVGRVVELRDGSYAARALT
jgi:hypothetical protein